jgi:hypothetical protein
MRHDAPGSQIDRRHLGLTLRKVRCGDYRVNFRDGNETSSAATSGDTTAFYGAGGRRTGSATVTGNR